jgi:phospholipase/carboxylesterase
MNRLVLDTPSAPVTKKPAKSNDRFAFQRLERQRRTEGEETTPATFAPMHYEANYSYPLIVWLHGSASNEHELRQIMPLVSIRNYVAVAPRGTTPKRQRGRYSWRQLSDSIELAQSRISTAIAFAQQKFNVHAKRVFLVGHGSGGTMALRVAWNDPSRFAGVVAINGALPTRFSPLCRVNEIRQLPCFLVTSRESRFYPATRVCDDLRLLHSAGCTVALRQYPGSDHLTTKMLDDLNHWLMELVCGNKSRS